MDALDSALAPLKPYLTPITGGLPKPLDDFVISLVGSKCHKSLLEKIDLSTRNSECFQLAISKALGVAIIGASAIVKVPQLIKLVQSKSAAGVSFVSYALETASFTITLAYNVRNNFPFSTYGENAFVAIQNVVIACLILAYSGRTNGAAAFVAVMAAAVYALFAPQAIVDMQTLQYLQMCAGGLAIASKLPQIWTIYQERSTGQLSAFAVFNYFIGSLARIFTTLQEVDDKLILYGFVAGFSLNAVMAAQMVYYWNSSPSTATKRVTGAQEKDKQQIPWGSETPIPASASKAKGPSTRRRG